MQPQTSLGRSKTGIRVNFRIKKVSRIEGIVAFKVVHGAVSVVRSGFQSNVDDRSRLPAILGRRILLRVELLNGVDGENRTGSSLHSFGIDDRPSVIGIVVIRAIHDKVVVLGTVSVGADGKEPAAGRPLYARPQDHEILEIAAVQWQIIDGLVRKCAAQCVVRRLHKRDLLGHFDDFRYAAGLHHQIQAYVLRYFQPDAGALDLFESRRLND